MRFIHRGWRYAKRYSRRSMQKRSVERKFAPLVPESLVVDVGASHFPHVPWSLFREASKSHWILIDPNESSLEYVDRWGHPSSASKVPYAVAGRDGDMKLFATHVPTGSSSYEPVIPESMRDRLGPDAQKYFFPVTVREVPARSLPSILASFDSAQPCVVKLDTQGSEVDILRPLESWLTAGRVVGVELEASLLAVPIYSGSPRFWQAQEWMESLGFELLRLNVIEAPVEGTFRNSRSYPHECDAVFALRPDVASRLPTPARALLLAFYVANQLYGEALRMLETDRALSANLIADYADVDELQAVLKRQL